MERRHFEIVLIGLTFVMTISLLFLRGMFVAIGTVGGTAATGVLMSSFITYSFIMIGVAASLLVPIGTHVYYSEATVRMDKMAQQEWVVQAEMKLEEGFNELPGLVTRGDYNLALQKYQEISGIYAWLKDYEVSEGRLRNYQLLLETLKTRIDSMGMEG